ncbi:MAG: hypothetical protein V4737_00505, partial [Curtobacterium sp.]
MEIFQKTGQTVRRGVPNACHQGETPKKLPGHARPVHDSRTAAAAQGHRPEHPSSKGSIIMRKSLKTSITLATTGAL